MRPAAGTRQITHEQREIIIRWHISCKFDRGESRVVPVSRRALKKTFVNIYNHAVPRYLILNAKQKRETVAFLRRVHLSGLVA